MKKTYVWLLWNLNKRKMVFLFRKSFQYGHQASYDGTSLLMMAMIKSYNVKWGVDGATRRLGAKQKAPR